MSYDTYNMQIRKQLENLSKPFNEREIFSHIKKLVITDNYKLEKDRIPNNIKEIIFRSSLNQSLDPGIIPNNVETIIFMNNQSNNLLQIGSIPFGIKKIDFSTLNQSLEPGIIPESVEELIFGSNCNHLLKIGDIPSSLKKLTLRYYKNKINKDVIPYGLTHLTFVGNFCDLDKDILPNTITHLIFEHITIPNQQGLKCFIPNSVKYLKIPDLLNPIIPGDIPNGVEDLILCGYGSIHSDDIVNYELIEGCIPNSVKDLEFMCYDNKTIKKGDIPEGVLKLKFFNCSNLKIETNAFPDSVIELDLGNCYNYNLKPNILPKNVKKLNLNMYSGKIDYNVIPDGVIELDLGLVCCPLKKGYIPNSVKKLIVASNFNQPIEEGAIPEGCEFMLKYKPLNYDEFTQIL